MLPALCRLFEVDPPAAAQALEAATQRREPARLQLLHRVLVAADDCRRLRQALALEKPQHNDVALLGGQLCEACLDLVERHVLVDRAERWTRGDLGRVVEGDLRLAWTSAHRVDQAVVRDAEHPGRERRALRLEAVDLLVDLREHVGGKVLGFFGVAVETLEQIAEDAWRVARVQLLECLRLVLSRTRRTRSSA